MNNNIKDSALFWKEARILGGYKRTCQNDNITLKDWFSHFKSVFEQCEDSESNIGKPARNLEENINHTLNLPISKDEVKHAIAGLKNGKSGGLDGVVPEMLKCGGEETIDFLHKLFNKIFDCGIYPREWSKAIVVPIFKALPVSHKEKQSQLNFMTIPWYLY